MRSAIFLSCKYIRAHKKQSIVTALITSVLVATFVMTMLLSNGYRTGTLEENDRRYGVHDGIIYNADMQKVHDNYNLIKESNSGVVSATMKIATNSGRVLYVGYMDENAINLRRITVRNGRMPEKENEIAIERATYNALGLTAGLGEFITISVVENGNNLQKKYVLVGILEDYRSMWERNSVTECQKTMPAPTLLTAKDNSTVEYMHIICGNRRIKDSFGGHYSDSGMDRIKDLFIKRTINIIDGFTVGFSGILLVFIVFGVTCTLLNTIRERQKYLGLLRCIGINRRKGVLMFGVQGFMLFIVSTVIGSVIGIALSYLLSLFLDISGLNMAYTLSIEPFIKIFAIVGVTITAVFVIPSAILFARAPLETSKHRYKRSRRKIKKDIQLVNLWGDSQKRKYIVQNILAVILVTIGMIASLLGTFLISAEAKDRRHAINAIDFDYQLNISGGTYGDFGINFPRNNGILKADYDRICENKDLIILEAGATVTSTQLFVYEEGSTDAYLKHLMSNERNVLKREEQLHYDELIAAVGCSENAHIVDPNISCIDYGTMLKYAKIEESDISKADYISGKYVVAPSSFSVGDRFTVVMPIVKSGVNVASKDREFDFIVNEITVAATYEGGYDNKIYSSAEYVTEADPSAGFWRMVLKHANSDPKTIEHNDIFLESIAESSSGVMLYNHGAEQREYVRLLTSGITFMAVIVFVIIASLIITIALSTKVKIRTNMHSYVVMMAVGANKKTVAELIKEDLSRQIMTGCIIGAVLAFAFCIWVGRTYDMSLIGIYVLMLAVVAAVFAIIYYLTVLSIKKNINTVLKSDIVSSINSVDL